jgi:hypothetical protein
MIVDGLVKFYGPSLKATKVPQFLIPRRGIGAVVSTMLTQGGSSACACAGGMQRGASAMAAAADTPNIALFIPVLSFLTP